MMDELNENRIFQLLQTSHTTELKIHKTLDSTNVEGKRVAKLGAPHGTVILAEGQTAGRGRMGRQFYSPGDTGLYMSILVRPDRRTTDIMLLTTATSVAVCRGIHRCYGVEPVIKWVNDIYLENKKVCGILAEGGMNPDTGAIDSVIIGIGINLRTKRFPDDIREIAASIEEYCNPHHFVTRNELVAALLDEFWTIYEGLGERAFMDEYRQRSMVIGRQVYLGNQENAVFTDSREVMVQGIDDDGGLIVEYPNDDGSFCREIIRTGEISLRLK